MKTVWNNLLCGSVVTLAITLSVAVAANQPGTQKRVASVPVEPVMSDGDLRVEGEKRFQANCGRCHQSPHKFSPRMMFTIERHMRVRALITDEDLRLIVRYLNQ